MIGEVAKQLLRIEQSLPDRGAVAEVIGIEGGSLRAFNHESSGFGVPDTPWRAI
jgi:hypothetical protein